ncbi:hypothetical protein CYLTODRAFT_354353 [Cylindrobasidium torrendii FP15055 ss-10]|uniref:SprT-like domain-containing protein n=1 Tax=Cylindrobasidium torrendii FP15055 ss-10 TaxID=1314674 RepID=A0A0D7B8K2_9AGAR|nr:hypothetical protein CYLTODRAFT_354353 [Cylindrobasidium torrendii FP15055 ss-10]
MSKQSTPKPRVPRANSKQAIETARLARLESYAQTLFDELNRSVFSDGLKGAQLLWSKTLQVTAGRASFRRHQDGRTETKIELAIKVLDCEERVRHTLAHEMCHLASWVISGRPTENHGSIFKGWGQRVEARRKDIKISTTHNYEITYKFNWKCDRCEMHYGRHSKSIKPEDRCGRCKEGRLMPQWEQRTRKPRLASTETTGEYLPSRYSRPGAYTFQIHLCVRLLEPRKCPGLQAAHSTMARGGKGRMTLTAYLPATTRTI